MHYIVFWEMIGLISKQEISKLASFSRLEFSDEELSRLKVDLEHLMELTSKVSEYNGELSCDCSSETHKRTEDNSYPHCSRDELLSGGVPENGFFFIKNNC